MKKTVKIVLIFVLIVAAILTFLNMQWRKPGKWVPDKNAGWVSKELSNRTEINRLNNILFYNDMYRRFDVYSPKPKISKAVYKIEPGSVSIIKGDGNEGSPELRVKGKEIILAAWIREDLWKKQCPDRMEILLSHNRDIKVTAAFVPAPEGVLNSAGAFFKERILGKLPDSKTFGDQEAKNPVAPNMKLTPLVFSFKTGTWQGERKSCTAPAGILLKIKSLRKRAVTVQIENWRLLTREFAIYGRAPRSDQYIYGGYNRRKMESVFVPGGSRIKYSIHTPNTQNQTGGFTIDGYLAVNNKKPATVILRIDGNEILTQPLTQEPVYFKAPVSPTQSPFKLEIQVKGDPGAEAVLGNLCVYKPMDMPRHVVFYLTDALRADKGGIKEPLFQKEFKTGAVFTNTYSNATRTGDSLPAIFSGKYKFLLVDKDKDVPEVEPGEEMLAEYFKRKGYVTAAFINNPWLDHSNSGQGFDILNHCWKHAKITTLAMPNDEDYYNPKYGDMEKQITAFSQAHKDKPVFIYIHTMEPHVPYEPPRDRRHYSKKFRWKVMKKLFKHVAQSPSYPSLKNPTTEELDALKAMYKDQVVIAYEFFKKIKNHLERESILNSNSLLVFTSDHGERFYEHKSWIHGPPDVYNEVLRIPLMIKGPGITPGTYNQPTQLLDIFPTMVKWLGDSPGKHLPGSSLQDITQYDKPRIIYADGVGEHPHFAFIKNNIKVIINNDKTEVYNLRTDPLEKTDLSASPDFQSLIAEARKYRKKFKSVNRKTKRKKQLSKKEKDRLKTLGYVH